MPKEKLDAIKLMALREEITMAEKINEEELSPIINEAVSRYTGKHVPHFGFGWDIILNEVYPIIQNELPSIFFRNPKAFLKPRNKTFIAKKRDPVTGKLETIQADSAKSAKTQEGILNYTVSEINYKREARKVLMDSLLFPYGVMWHGYKGDFGMTDEASHVIRKDSVFVRRLNPMNFIKDPCVNMADLDEARWTGRIIWVPLDDILEDDKLDVDPKLKGVKGFSNLVGTKTELERQGEDAKVVTSLRKKPLVSSTSKEFQESNASKFVKVYEIYIRPTKKEKREGGKGKIVLLTDQQKKPLRVNSNVIQAEGSPAKILEFNMLNDHEFGMADIDAYKQIADQKNIITNLQIRNAQEQTKTWVGLSKEGADEEDIEHVKQGTNSIILFEDGDPKQRMYVASPGGNSSSELYLIDQRIQRNLEDKSGVTDLKRGFLQSGEESAASVKLRAAGGGARPAYRQDIMADFLRESYHYINQLNKQFMPIKDAVRILGTLNVEWTEDYTKEDLQADTDVEINVVSMLPENPEKELQSLQQTLLLAVQSLESPIISQKIEQEGRTISLTPLIEQILMRQRINDPNIFRNIEPEESMGFVSVQQLREAKQNVAATLAGQQVPFPPSEEDDHVAKLETYMSTATILEAIGQVSDQLTALIQAQQQLLQAAQEKQDRPGQPLKLDKGSVTSV